MKINGKPTVFVVVQLSGGNDFMNTLIPYGNDIYYDSRPVIGIPQEEILPIDGYLGWNPNFAPVKELYDEGSVAVVQGVGYPNSSRSHFRGTDIWHTAEPNKIGTEGWLGKAVAEMDPNGQNPLTCVNIGRGLPRAMSKPGVPITSVGDLDNYGVMTGISDQSEREQALRIFEKMYGPAVGTGVVREYVSRTGMDVLRGADVLKRAPESYTSNVEYAGQPDSPKPARRRPRPPRRPRNANHLHPARRLRHPRQRSADPSAPAKRAFWRHNGLLPRPARP